jgi:superfamily II DNA or RNA helicase
MKLLVRRPDLGYLDTLLWVPKQFINVEGTKRALTYEFFDRQDVNILTLYRETKDHLLLPREFWRPEEYAFPVIDCRPARYTRVDIRSKVKLDHRVENGQLVPNGETIQQEAMNALLSSRGGVLQLRCGGGKTVVALDFAARRGVPLLIILDTTELIRQWREEIADNIEVPDGIGLIQGDTFDWKKPVVIATYHTLASKAHLIPEEVRRWFGTIVWDEGHHIAAPTFARTADLFYGLRLALTATPDRDDGYHVIYNFHLGPVIYKNLRQELKPKIFFIWTSMGLDANDPLVQAAARDRNGELHIGKIASFLGGWPQRIDFVLNQVRQAIANDRKVLVLSKSVDALVNLLAAWNCKGQPLITDIPFPTAQDVGETVPPVELDKRTLKKIYKQLGVISGHITKLGSANSAALQGELIKKAQLDQALESHRVYKKCEALWNKERGAYLKTLLNQSSDAGLMIYKVKPDQRAAMLRSKKVTFAIMKYGKEGLNERALDTVIVNEPLSSANALQQLMGRILRKKDGKQEPVVVFLEDDIGPFIGMCKKLRSHLSSWPADQNGPLAYENIGHITRRPISPCPTTQSMFKSPTRIQ